MPLDVNGVWQYTETEPAAPVSTMLNRLGKSVSDQLAPLVHDSGWVNVPTALPSPWTSSLKARRRGDSIEVKGDVHANGTVWGAINNPQILVTDLPDEFTPIDTRTYLCASTNPNSAEVQFRVTIQSNGQIVARCNQVNYNAGVAINQEFRAN